MTGGLSSTWPVSCFLVLLYFQTFFWPVVTGVVVCVSSSSSSSCRFRGVWGDPIVTLEQSDSVSLLSRIPRCYMCGLFLFLPCFVLLYCFVLLHCVVGLEGLLTCLLEKSVEFSVCLLRLSSWLGSCCL